MCEASILMPSAVRSIAPKAGAKPMAPTLIPAPLNAPTTPLRVIMQKFGIIPSHLQTPSP
ncbi:hypothetical protein Pth03_40680 [Planotetraspora thailandica]|uniref:Uncharacterized protein n=1 Tax=Planotetraspora thailandica TaxID=487172 RepID=A0A8J3V800_9ACTN|nr:hypothetical protein Pth03_40680 [Planotetraspora thailandica]